MTKEELIQRLEDLEWEDFEVKEAKGEVPKNSWETVSAFSNTSGGWLLFGIKQVGKRFEVQGVKNPEKIEQDFLNTLRDGNKFNVKVSSKQAKHDIDGKTVLAFYISVSDKKPVYYNSKANTFIRRGSSDQRATAEEIDAMYRDQTFGTKTSVYLRDNYGLNADYLRDKMNERSIHVLLLMAIEPTVRKNELAKILAVSESTIEKNIKSLSEKGLVRREGSRKTGRWLLQPK